MSNLEPNQESNRAVLVLENGYLFEGIAIGAPGSSVGEVVFNTAMTGYQEILTDPSYAKQIITLTHPHIGNTGMNEEDDEAEHLWATGLIIRDLPLVASNWRATETLQAYLQRRKVVAMANVDTRKLTRLLRQQGVQKGCILSGDTSESAIATARDAARSFEGLKGTDLAKAVTTAQAYSWQAASWKLGEGYGRLQEPRFKVVVYDFGVKRNILRMLVDRGCDLTVVPAQTPASEVLARAPDGIFLSNGPGDPEPCDYAIQAIGTLLESKRPMFGICLGLQILGLACGMKTIKMKHGHHGANHPVKNLKDDTVLITSQNHGFCIDDQTLPAHVKVTHRSLFDDSIQGIHLTNSPAFGFQGHPEASPGPHDAAPLFDHFIDLMQQHSNQHSNQQKEAS